MAKRNDGRRAQMRALLAEQEASGLSVAAFSRQRGLSRWLLYEWRRRLRDTARVPAPCGERPAFTEVRLIEEPASRPELTVELSSGHRVRVPSGFDAHDLRRLVEILGSC